MVAGRGADRRGASLNFSPLPESVRARYQHVPVVARSDAMFRPSLAVRVVAGQAAAGTRCDHAARILPRNSVT